MRQPRLLASSDRGEEYIYIASALVLREMLWYQKEVGGVLTELRTTDRGLSSAEVAKRLRVYGKNTIGKEKPLSILRLFWNQVNDPLVWVLVVAIALSIVIRNYVDAVIILAIVVFDAAFGFFQEYKAERAIQLLRKLREYKARVVRDGKDVLVDADDLVPGDILVLGEGSKVPADGRVVEVYECAVDEASLTGESVPVSKTQSRILQEKVALGDQKNMVFAGTQVVRGSVTVVVVATGAQTELGKVAKELEAIQPEMTPLQKRLKEMGKWLTISIVAIALGVFLLGMVRGFTVVDMFLVAVSLAVAAIPEGLPAVVVVTLAIGVRRMLRRKALVRRLRSVETLGSVSVICSDKTGTLTRNEMTVTKLFSSFKEYDVTGTGYHVKGELRFNGKKVGWRDVISLLLPVTSCNDATLTIGDPTERALKVLAAKGKVEPKKRVSEVPFSSDTKFMSVTDADGVVYMKGAPEVVIEKCSMIAVDGKVRRMTPEDKKRIFAKNEDFTRSALRVLACAYGKKALVFSGLVGMIDPPRKEVRRAVALCASAGVRSVMITGDHELTARAVAQQVGIVGEAVSGKELDTLTDKELQRVVRNISVYARVTSLHKTRILRALQANGEIVAMTGDGVNDAPALKQADVGVAMNIKGTDVAKDVSGIILMDDNFATIVAAVEEGRIVYANIKKFVKYLLAANFGEIAIVLLPILLGLPLPLLPLHLLWVNLVTDSFPALALGVDPAEPDVMRRGPRDPKESFFVRMKMFIVFSTVISLVLLLGVFVWYLQSTNLAYARTMVFTGLVLFELFLVFACRSDVVPLFSLKANTSLYAAVGFSFFLQLVLLYSPLSQYFSLVPLQFVDWVILLPLASLGLVFFEAKKMFTRMSSGPA